MDDGLFYYGLIALWAVVVVGTTFLFVQARHEPSIKHRGVNVTVLCAVIGLLLFFYYISEIVLLKKAPCIVYFWMSSLLVPAAFLTLGVKFWKLIVLYQSAECMLYKHNQNTKLVDEDASFSKDTEFLCSNLNGDARSYYQPKPEMRERRFLNLKQAACRKVLGLLQSHLPCITNRTLCLVATGLWLMHLLISAVVTLLTPKHDITFKLSAMCVKGWEWYPEYLLVSTYLLVMIPALVCVLPKFKDTHGIQWEMFAAWSITIISLVVYMVISYVRTPGFRKMNEKFPPGVWMAISSVLLHNILVIWPLVKVHHRSWRYDTSGYGGSSYSITTQSSSRYSSCFNRKDEPQGFLMDEYSRAFADELVKICQSQHGQKHSARWNSFIHVLRTPQLFQEFKAFTVRDFSVENGLFHQYYIQLCVLYRSQFPANEDGAFAKTTEPSLFPTETTSNGGDRLFFDVAKEECIFRKIPYLYQQFIQPGAPYELNLKAQTVLKIRSQISLVQQQRHPSEDHDTSEMTLQLLTPAIFAGAHEEVLELMYTHTFPKFIKVHPEIASSVP